MTKVWILEHQQDQPRAFAEDFDMHNYLREDILDAVKERADGFGGDVEVDSERIFIDDWLCARLVEVENGLA